MGKKSTNPKYQKYLNTQKRIKNKTEELEKKIEKLEKFRKENPPKVNPNTKEIVQRKPIENIIKSSRIGRKKEGFKIEDFKKRPSKKPIIKKEIKNERGNNQ